MSMRTGRTGVGSIGILALGAAAATAQVGVERASVSSAGVEGNADSTRASISASGRYVAFESDATNLVPGGAHGVFVHDRLTGQTESLTVGSNGESRLPSISGDGRYVAFESDADDLVPGDTNGVPDVFVVDRLAGGIVRVSVSSSGVQADAGSGNPSISADGDRVAFGSAASNLVVGDANGVADVFVHDLSTNQTERVSVSTAGVEGDAGSGAPSLSADGCVVAFGSDATNLVAGDSNGSTDVFVRDLVAGQTERVSESATDIQGNGASGGAAISGDGTHVAFGSVADDLVPMDTNSVQDVFVKNRLTGHIERVSVSSSAVEGDSGSGAAALSFDGLCVAFGSEASNLVSGDTNGLNDVFLHDRASGETVRASESSSGVEGDGGSARPSISADGCALAFGSEATTLVPGDSNGAVDVFVREEPCAVGAAYCFGDGSGAPCPCGNQAASGAGCMNSGGAGAVLGGSGSTSVAADDLLLGAVELLPGQPALLFAGLAVVADGDGIPFGDGLRCAGVGVVRLGAEVPDAGGAASWGPGLAASAGWLSGDLRYFQVWYRDPSNGPCGTGFNLSNGLEVAFTP